MQMYWDHPAIWRSESLYDYKRVVVAHADILCIYHHIFLLKMNIFTQRNKTKQNKKILQVRLLPYVF